MMSWGGKREGAGRPRGSESEHTRRRREAARKILAHFELEHPDAFPGDAVSLLQCIYRHPDLPLEVRIDAASKCARYERPALTAAVVRDVTPDKRDPGSRNARILELLEKGLAGVAIALIEG